MRILDVNNNDISNQTIDLSKGRLTVEQIVKEQHPAIAGKAGKYHYEPVKKYSNGGMDVKKVWDEEPVKAQDAWTEYEQIQRYVAYTDEELANIKAANEKAKLEAEAPTRAELSSALIDVASQVAELATAVASASTSTTTTTTN